jgi:hypothetical protein
MMGDLHDRFWKPSNVALVCESDGVREVCERRKEPREPCQGRTRVEGRQNGPATGIGVVVEAA